MADAFDPYEKWLGIPKNKRPLTSYRLLGVEVFESDLDRIGRRAERRIELVEKQKESKHGAVAKKVLQQLVEARECLLDPVKKEKYDRMLRQKLGKDAPPPPPPSPVSVDGSDDSTDDMSMFNFAGGKAPSSNGSGGSHSYSTAGFEPEPKGGLKSNFWVIPVAIGGAGLVLLVIAIFMVGNSKPTPIANKKDETKEKGKTKDPPKNVLEAIPDPAKKTEKIPESGAPVTKEGLIGKWTSEKVEGVADLKEVEYVFKKDGKFVETRTFQDSSQKMVLGTYKVVGTILSTTVTGSKEDQRANVVLKDKKLVMENSAAKSNFVLAKAEEAPPTTPVGPTPTNPEKTDPPEVAETEPDTLPVWGGAADPLDPADAPGPLSLARVEGIKPAFPVGSFAVDPKQKAAALGALKGGKIEVWDLEEKKLKCTPEVQGDDVVAVAMPSAQKLIAWTAKGGLLSFNAATGALDKALPVPAAAEAGANFQPGLVVSPGGKYLAVCRKGIRIYRTSDYKLAGIIPTPKGEQVISQGFRIDGTELVVVYQSRTAPFMMTIALIGLANGKVDDELTKKRPGDLRNNVGPLDFRTGDMNRQYVFVGNQGILDGEGGRVVWRIRNEPRVMVPLDSPGQFFVIDDKGVVATPKINWDKLDGAVKQLSLSAGGVQISPDDPVGVEVRVAGTINTDSIVKSRLEQILTARLRADGFTVNPTAATKLVVEYSEKSGGKRTQIDYLDKSFEVRTKKVDSFSAIVATVKMSWTGYGWSIGFSEGENTNTEDQMNGPPEKTFALGVLETVAGMVSSIDIPYFVAESALDGSVQLPIIVPGPKFP